jgi:hypothetical protein
MPTTVLDQPTLGTVLDLLLPGVKCELGKGWDVLARPERTSIDVVGPNGETVALLDKGADIRTGYWRRVVAHRLQAVARGLRPDPERGWEDIDDAAIG